MNQTHTLFIDESGKPDLDDLSYKHFLLSGVVIPKVELANIEGYLTFIKRKYQLPDKPLHAYDIFENPHSKTHLSASKCKEFVNSMCEFISLVPIDVLLCTTNKNRFIKKHGIKAPDLRGSREKKAKRYLLYSLATIALLSKFVKILDKKGSNGEIYVDSRKYLDEQVLKAFLDIKEPTWKGNLKNPTAKAAEKLTTITFANKSALSGGLELVDFISYTMFAKINRRLTEFKFVNLSKAAKVVDKKLSGGSLLAVDNGLASRYL
jgi:hypothetical protein